MVLYNSCIRERYKVRTKNVESSNHSEKLWKKLFFPLEKVKIPNWSSEGG